MLRYGLCVLAGLGLLSGGMALAGLALLGLVEIGNCATSQVYQTRRDCPEGTAALILIPFGAILAGLAGAGLYAGRAAPDSPWADGPNWAVFWWPAMFLGLAAMFWSMTGEVAQGQGGEIAWWTFVSLAGMFVLMGLVPMLIALPRLPALLFGGAGAGSLFSARVTVGPRHRRSAGTVTLAPGGRSGGSGDLAQSLDTLAQLHRQGAITDAEFARAKGQLLSRGDGS